MTSDLNLLNPTAVILELKCTPSEKTHYECLWVTFIKEKNRHVVKEIRTFPTLHEGCSAHSFGMYQHVGWNVFIICMLQTGVVFLG